MLHTDNKQASFLSRIIPVTVLISGLMLCLMSCKKSEKVAGPPEKITIAYSTASNAVLVYIAFAKGYFAEEGLDATPQPYPFGKLALNAVLDGKADLATAADTPIVFAVTGGRKIYTIAVIQTSDRNEAIVARQDRGIRSPTDLKGKKIGVTRGTSGDFFANSFLLANGIDGKQVKIIDMTPVEMPYALSSGRVDAVSTWNPTLRQLQKELGNNGHIFYGQALYTETFCIAAEQDFIRKHPEAVKKFLRAVVRAEIFAKQYPEESRRLVAEFINTDRAVLDEIWDLFDFKVTLEQSLLISLEDQTRWAMKSGLTERTEMPNYLDFIYFEGLQAVRPEAVTIIR
jgi:sulfonate transport system substrate-binding protein